GGDFFDLFAYWDDHIAFVVGDATGKGLEAAATTSEVKYALRAYLHDDTDPGVALTRLNRFLAASRKEDTGTDFVPPSFVSLTLAVLNRQTGELRTASAGAEAPLLLRVDGTAIEAGETGTMLGASADSVYTAQRFTMESGDTIAMVTDGVTEARRGQREFFGYEGFTNGVRSASEADAATLSTIAQSVVAAAKSFAGGRLHDDVCLLIARRE
ncbi:MAG: serine/threonine-protein phosphatase, partial [Armatimonadetes bacterium]|nr:serine/threonine-protein phosphatase [Armatimonadota bacterium]